MTASSDLESIGACVRCGARLRADERAFLCVACGARWPVVRGVPRFVESERYVSNFGFEWRRHRRTQVDSSASRVSEETFRAKTGLAPDDVRGKLVLDVGVGTGRFSDVVGRFGGVPVGVDLSRAVETARRNLARYPGALVVQADAFRLPFRPASFDAVFSIGVLHHTPSTRGAFRAIAPLVKPGGTLAVAVYRDHPTFYRYADRYRRYTTAMSSSLLHLISHVAIPKQHLVELVRALGRFGPYFAGQIHTAFPTRDHPDPQWRVLDTFDWYSPLYQWKHEPGEVEQWFSELGFERIEHLAEETMVCVRGRRPERGELATPPPSDERKSGAIAPPPSWVGHGPLGDLALLAMLAGEACRTVADVTRDIALEARAKLQR